MKFLQLIIIGLLISTSAFADGIDSYVVFGTHANGADGATSTTDFSTAQAAKTITFAGNCQLDTAQTKFGASSLLYDGTTDYISLDDSADFDFGSGDFTIDFWVRFANVSGEQWFYGQTGTGSNEVLFRKNDEATHKLQIYTAKTGVGVTGFYTMTNNWAPSADTWYHIAVVRNGTSCLMFIDGVSQGVTQTTAFGTLADVDGPLDIGVDRTPSASVNGWLDEYRVSKGIARWTANFTPSTSEYSGSASRTNDFMSFCYTD